MLWVSRFKYSSPYTLVLRGPSTTTTTVTTTTTATHQRRPIYPNPSSHARTYACFRTHVGVSALSPRFKTRSSPIFSSAARGHRARGMTRGPPGHQQDTTPKMLPGVEPLSAFVTKYPFYPQCKNPTEYTTLFGKPLQCLHDEHDIPFGGFFAGIV